MTQITNIETVNVGSVGKLALAEKPGTFTPSGVKREHKAGRKAVDGGFSESETPAKLELNLNLIAGVNVTALNKIKNEDVTVRLSDGSVHLMPRAFAVEVPGIADGDSKLTLMSNTSEEV